MLCEWRFTTIRSFHL